MTIDPILSLSFSMCSSPGAYALLLGSGISRSAGIPTGWEITLELIKNIAIAKGGAAPANPDQWYLKEYETEPSYSSLLDQLAKSKADRSNYLKTFFEPSEEERIQNIKMPSRAHRAIANMVSKKHIRVIITTNFDRLLEQALEDVSIRPVVISTGDQVKGAPPLVHTPCVILKVNGDYLDNRIRNTTQELETYDPATIALLEQIFDEFGLVVCGWSGDWDIALCNSIMRSPSRRYVTFWATKGTLSQSANKIVNNKGAIPLQIVDADSFFESLEEKINALEEFKQPHPLSIATIIVTLKKYIVDDIYRIRLHDLLVELTDKTIDGLAQELGDDFLNNDLDQSSLLGCLKRTDGICAELVATFATIGRWGNQAHIEWLCDAIVKIASFGETRLRGKPANLSIRHLPTLYMIYAAGMGLIKANNYGAIEAIVGARVRSKASGLLSPIIEINPYHMIVDSNALSQHPELENRETSLSSYLLAQLRPVVKPMVASEEDYKSIFLELELLFSMIYLRNELDQGQSGIYTIPGLWIRKRRHRHESDPLSIVLGDISRSKEDWRPLQSGFFGGNLERVQEVVEPLRSFYDAC